MIYTCNYCNEKLITNTPKPYVVGTCSTYDCYNHIGYVIKYCTQYVNFDQVDFYMIHFQKFGERQAADILCIFAENESEGSLVHNKIYIKMPIDTLSYHPDDIMKRCSKILELKAFL